jgi:hypothetical protein
MAVTKHNKHDTAKVFDMVAHCLVKVFDKDEVYFPDSHKEAVAFIESLPHHALGGINEFFNAMPTITADVAYTCSGCGQEEKLALRGLKDFF